MTHLPVRVNRTDAAGRYTIDHIWGGARYVVRAARLLSRRPPYGPSAMSEPTRADAERATRVPDLVLRQE